jgi:inositol oxygenase
VGDTFVVGCKFSDKIIYPETFSTNPDFDDPKLMTENGIYEPGCGLDNVLLTWGHDEYIYNIMKKQSKLPKEALSMLRYHSFYPWHREGAYRHLMNRDDEEQLKAVQAFNAYDL